MKVLSVAAATIMLGAVATPNPASAQSFGFSFGTPGWGAYYSNYDYDDYYGYGRRGYGYRSSYYSGYGVPYAYYGGPRVYGYTRRVSWGYPRNYYRGDYVRDGIPGETRDWRVSSRTYGYVDRGSAWDNRRSYYRTSYIRDGVPSVVGDRRINTDRVRGYTERRGDWVQTRLVRDNIPGNSLERGPRVAGFTQRSNLVIDPPVRSAGGCGTFFFWNGSTCVDARLR
jgi:hypothetical protein